MVLVEVHYRESVTVHVRVGGKSERSKRARKDEIITIISGREGSRTSLIKKKKIYFRGFLWDVKRNFLAGRKQTLKVLRTSAIKLAQGLSFNPGIRKQNANKGSHIYKFPILLTNSLILNKN